VRGGDEPVVGMRRRSFRLGGHLVEPDRNRIVGPAGEALLEPKVMDVLTALAAEPGDVLSREAIIDRVWGRSHGADESLTRAVSLLRKAFAGEGGPVIETVARRGYRLAAPVTDVPGGERPARTGRRGSRRRWIAAGVAGAIVVAAVLLLRWTAPGRADGEAIAVAIQVRADDLQGRRLASGLNDALARAPLFRVREDDAGPVDYRIAVAPDPAAPGAARMELADGRSGTLLWTATVAAAAAGDGQLEPATIRARTGQAIGRMLAATKRDLRRRPVDALEPWQLVLLASWVPGDDEVFLRPHGPGAFYLQRRALRLDPRYAPAHASLASGLAYHALFDPAAATAAAAREAAGHAAEARALAPYDPDVLYELANYQRLTGERATAAATLARVVALQPGNPLAAADAVFVDALCTPRAAAGERRLRAMLAGTATDDPVRWVLLSHLADLELGAGDWAGAARDAAASRQIVHQTWSGITLAAALAELGRRQEAHAIARETKLEWPRLDWARFAGTTVRRWCLGGDASAAGRAFAALAAAETRGNRPILTPPSGPPQDPPR
jgi:DNA-binding winged helix-turn-helix (wHTH) protein/tetratricopeptide (TPR) repeat protein